MGFHPLDWVVIVGIALLIFGPKTLQSISHSAGRGLGQAKDVKDKVLAEMPVEEFSQVTKAVGRIPLSPQQAAQKLLSAALIPDEQRPQANCEPDQEALQQGGPIFLSSPE